MGHKSVAIDGPSGAGKSTLARQVAKALGFLYVDTGAIYRTLGTVGSGTGNRSGRSGGGYRRCCLRLTFVWPTTAVMASTHMYLCGRDVTEDIRRPEVSLAASSVSAIQTVRDFLMETQREAGPSA